VAPTVAPQEDSKRKSPDVALRIAFTARRSDFLPDAIKGQHQRFATLAEWGNSPAISMQPDEYVENAESV
jgi:hypothetical protein